MATLDSHTSDICQEMDGKHFPMNQWEVGVTAPPFHPWCRSVTVPYFDDEWGRSGERVARGEDGKTYYVPADMTYPEWKKSLVGDNPSLNLQQISPGGIIKKKDFSHLKGLTDSFEASKVSFKEVQEHAIQMNEADIISMVGGADKTQVSCA